MNAPAQSADTLKGLFYLPLAITTVSTLLAVIPYFLYNYTHEKQENVVEALLAAKASVIADFGDLSTEMDIVQD